MLYAGPDFYGRFSRSSASRIFHVYQRHSRFALYSFWLVADAKVENIEVQLGAV